MNLAGLILTFGAAATTFAHSGLAADFRDFPGLFKSERVSVPVENISCETQETSAPPGAFPGVRAQVKVTGFFIDSSRQKLDISVDRPLGGTLATRTMVNSKDCDDFLDEVRGGEAIAIRQGKELLLVTPGYNVLSLK